MIGASLLWLCTPDARAQATHDQTILVTATVQESPAQIQLNWLAPSTSGYNMIHQKIWRRTPGSPSWGKEYDTLATNDLSYTDTNVSPGVRYEYRIVRLYTNGPRISTGYIETGIRIPVVDRRGSIILLVKDNAASGLATEITQLQQNLAGDGWHIIREDITSSQTVTDVKAIITGHYNNAATPDVKSVFILGDLPVPYSGEIAPDGHVNNHLGAWPADVFYAEMNGTWTDTTVNNTTAPARTQNIPGDGKYDQSILPSAVELEIGRLDLSEMTIFPNSSTTEIDLLRRYLTKNHNYRHLIGNYASIPRRGLLDDHFGNLGSEAFSSSAWRNYTSFFGFGNITSADWFGTLQTNNYLWAFGAGSGGYNSASGVGNSAQFGTTDSKAVFCMLFGSYFGDWDNPNNFLRAPLANTPNGLGLASMWTGRPQWHLHTMATGRPIGYGTRITQNNVGEYSTGFGAAQVHVALMGDPSLRLFPVIPPSGLSAVPTAGKVTLNWTASTDTNLQGYAIYRGPVGADTTGDFVRINPSLVTGTSYDDLSGVPGTTYTYMVRAVKLETTSSATYLNSSQGIFQNATPSAVSGPEISISGNGNPIQTGTTAGLEVNHTDFGSGEINLDTQEYTFTIKNDGTSNLTMSGPPTVTLSGTHAADFTITLQPASNPLASGNQTTFSIRFAPSAIGLRTAFVNITSNDFDETNFVFAITGTGTPNTPDIELPVSTFSKTLSPAASDTSNMVINNNGLGNLDHTITSKYLYRDSNHGSGPSYVWDDISIIGTEITTWSGSSAPSDNGGSASIPIGFSFPFFDSSFSSLRVSTEGFITFGNWSNAPVNSPGFPSFSAPTNMIAVYWDDLDLRSDFPAANQGRVYYLQKDPDTFIIQYEGVYEYNPEPELTDDRLSCQLILKSTGEILMYYKEIPTTSDYTIGFQNNDYDDGLTVSGNTAYLSASMAVRILPPATTIGNWLTPSPANGTITPSGTSNITLTFDPTSIPFDSYFGCLNIDSNDPDTPVTLVNLELDGGSSAPEIEITGNNMIIPYNSSSAFFVNHTHLGEHVTSSPMLTRTFTIHNTGSAALNLGTITVSGSNFTVTAPASSTVAAGASTTFQVNFLTTAEGTYNATVTVPSNDSNEASFTFAVAATQLVGIESWRMSHFGNKDNTGNGANDIDKEKDGLKNLVEYGLDGDPNVSDVATIRPIYSRDGSGRLQIQFNRYPSKTDINYIIEASSDLVNWTQIAISTAGAVTTNTSAFSVNESGSSPVSVTVTDTVVPPTIRFIRLRIVEN